MATSTVLPSSPPTQFKDLPVELMIRVISHTLPEGFESLALSCKQIHRLCVPYIAHHNLLSKQYRNFRYIPGHRLVRKDPRNAFELLGRIAAEPIVARYIRHADLRHDSYRCRSFMPPLPDLGNGEMVLDMMAKSAHVARAGIDYNEFYARLTEECNKSRTEQFSQNAAAFVLTLLPNAKSVALPLYWRPTEETDKLVSIITADAKIPGQSSCSLAKVSRLYTNWESERPDALEFTRLWPLLSLPKIRTFHGDGLTDRDILTGAERRQLPPGPSKTLEHIYMSGCIGEAAMTVFLRAAVRLETFVYYQDAAQEESNAKWDIYTFIRMVERETGPRLQRLYINTACALAPGPLLMRRFTRLRQLVLPLEIFQCYMSDSASRIGRPFTDLTKDDAKALGLRLSDLIPASVTELTLLSPGKAEHAKALQVLFFDFGTLKATGLPALEEINLECLATWAIANTLPTEQSLEASSSPGFCSTYLASVTAVPSPVATCGPTRISSACNCLETAPPAPTKQVINGGFESGNLGAWVPQTAGGWISVRDNSESTTWFPFRARTGTKLAQWGNPGEEMPDKLSQQVNVIAGTRYAFNAYYSILDLALGSCHLSAFVGDTNIAEVVLYPGGGGGNPPRYYKLEGIFRAPTTATTDLTLQLWCDYTSIGGVFGLDDVSFV
ncbi:hypothetical protein B0I35DRAFT_513503 [Stachybotrys elegans]|uniref:F-box domain-containing protein n=1 Tax=Stachybotrys elegans TaxID=80388 RepID=A0A8K0SQ88_9HYPO|nr:hypothetical protein B0I35DRAFT_513503 [Stachybotrys elegans]